MSVDVKICGITSKEALDAALDGGAAYVGFVFYPPSPRNIDIEIAAELRSACRSRAKAVALFVDPTDDELRSVMDAVDPDTIQLHGNETPDRVDEIRRLFGKPIIKAVPIASNEDAAAAEAYRPYTDIILFDAKPPKVGENQLPGGNGVAFDWESIAQLGKTKEFMLSGGLNPDNVAAAIELTGASAVDVSSGVEIARGQKDPALIRRFLQAARQHN